MCMRRFDQAIACNYSTEASHEIHYPKFILFNLQKKTSREYEQRSSVPSSAPPCCRHGVPEERTLFPPGGLASAPHCRFFRSSPGLSVKCIAGRVELGGLRSS
ncbi:unnamed protein product [Ostreobium quekettii]|uniref:Uncharacterized protein n=1 Tax=Ostreobium quekettii TaxID=121088 RepID=A0A8S1J057_9CHLO|nr:unnamed protein product [Ostreobium quekettii]